LLLADTMVSCENGEIKSAAEHNLFPALDIIGYSVLEAYRFGGKKWNWQNHFPEAHGHACN
jgi:hypothetical protein